MFHILSFVMLAIVEKLPLALFSKFRLKYSEDWENRVAFVHAFSCADVPSPRGLVSQLLGTCAHILGYETDSVGVE